MNRNPENTGPESRVQGPESETRPPDPGPGTPDSGPNDGADYYLTVESHFAERRGTPFIFSAKDWALLQQWRESGVPLPVVIEAIDQCFEKREKAGKHKVVSSLRYCRHAVNELWEERKQLLVGSGSGLPELDPATRLAQLADELAQSGASAEHDAVSEQLNTAAERIREIAAGKSVPLIEDALLEIEEWLMERLGQVLPASTRSDLEEQIERELNGYSTADPVVLEKTRKANLRRLIRQRLSLPRLSLFS